MRIEGPKSRVVVGRARAKGATDRPGQVFETDEGGASEATAQPRNVSVPAAIDNLVMLQAVDDPVFARRKKVRHGLTMLDVLDDMKADLLAGRVSLGRLNRLTTLVQQARDSGSGEIDQVLEDIDLRARVELAKLGRFT